MRTERAFVRGKGSRTFRCRVCCRNTRITSQIDVNPDTCGECSNLAGQQNAVWDGCYDFTTDTPYRDKLLAKIVKLGGDGDKVKAYFADLFSDA